jgi:hypothetical protein
MKFRDISIVDVPEWEGIYVNGELYCSGDRLQTTDILDAAGVRYTIIRLDEDKFFEAGGQLPLKKKDLAELMSTENNHE